MLAKHVKAIEDLLEYVHSEMHLFAEKMRSSLNHNLDLQDFQEGFEILTF